MYLSAQQEALERTPINRLNALRKKHESYKARIKEAQNSLSSTDFYLKQLKRQKLFIKEEIEGIRQIRRAS